MEADPGPPVVAKSEIEIAETPEAVWDVLTDFRAWPSWNPDVKSMSFAGEVAEGSEFKWKAGPGTITSTIRRVERPRLISWTGKTLGTNAVHVYRLEPRDETTLVSTEESFDGLVARIFRGAMQKMVKKSLDTGLQHLKAQVEEAG
jgi:uncharacterized protein YndB with AHSA1/START domain